MNFGEALKLVKGGRLMAREGWNGVGMFIFMGFPRVEIHAKSESGRYEIDEAAKVFGCSYSGPSLCMKNVKDEIVVGWLASQTDMLSNDWIEFNYPVKPGI